MRRPASAGEWAVAVGGAALGGAVVAALFFGLAEALMRHPSGMVVVVLLAVSAVLYCAERLTAAWTEQEADAALVDLDGLDHAALTLAVRDLMRRDGCTAEAAAHGLFAQTPEGVRLHVRVEGTRSNGGVDAYAVFAARDAAIPGRRSALVVTNGSYTPQARTQAATLGVHLMDRTLLHRWSTEGRPLTTLLPLPHPHP
ncbi:restriction endonuclease [Actinocorallia herbida]|uniref:restriction endonuclease n=1 Tax=Actinocorallia herbida TaxID=58109 RepID=UPI000F4B4817|nr:restriction endonuclease [Actinocorallia herbida]